MGIPPSLWCITRLISRACKQAPSPKVSPEVEVLECEVGFYNAGGFDPGSEDVLLSGLVVSGSNPIQAVQVAVEDIIQESMDLGPSHYVWSPVLAIAFARLAVATIKRELEGLRLAVSKVLEFRPSNTGMRPANETARFTEQFCYVFILKIIMANR